ncbi:DNA ligase 4 [Symbiodinium microadriaticum]|uniref:DNA ligase 4 n=1 Tax=Symbiodinium microadriaticum TaxID=2951 RepID=A0A1Q9ECN0_SYMMI|nr:DNA ligase 4 [Symbiodinium microadriaticum]
MREAQRSYFSQIDESIRAARAQLWLGVSVVTVCKVGTGFSMEQLKEMRAKLRPHLKRYDPHRAPSWMGGWRGGPRSKPDAVIDSPANGFVMEVRAAEIVPTEEYEFGHTLRFPRAVKPMREDKEWVDANTDKDLSDFLVEGARGALAGRRVRPKVEVRSDNEDDTDKEAGPSPTKARGERRAPPLRRGHSFGDLGSDGERSEWSVDVTNYDQPPPHVIKAFTVPGTSVREANPVEEADYTPEGLVRDQCAAPGAKSWKIGLFAQSEDPDGDGEVLEGFRPADTAQVPVASQLLKGAEVFVVNGDAQYSKADLEAYVVRHGGRNVQNFLRGRTDLVLAAALSDLRTQNLAKTALVDIVVYTYLFECENAGKMLPLKPCHMLAIKPETKEQFSVAFDPWGDAFYEEVTPDSLRIVLDRIGDADADKVPEELVETLERHPRVKPKVGTAPPHWMTTGVLGSRLRAQSRLSRCAPCARINPLSSTNALTAQQGTVPVGASTAGMSTASWTDPLRLATSAAVTAAAVLSARSPGRFLAPRRTARLCGEDGVEAPPLVGRRLRVWFTSEEDGQLDYEYGTVTEAKSGEDEDEVTIAWANMREFRQESLEGAIEADAEGVAIPVEHLKKELEAAELRRENAELKALARIREESSGGSPPGPTPAEEAAEITGAAISAAPQRLEMQTLAVPPLEATSMRQTSLLSSGSSDAKPQAAVDPTRMGAAKGGAMNMSLLKSYASSRSSTALPSSPGKSSSAATVSSRPEVRRAEDAAMFEAEKRWEEEVDSIRRQAMRYSQGVRLRGPSFSMDRGDLILRPS